MTQVVFLWLIIKELHLESKQINITVCFLQEIFDNGILVPKDEKYSVSPADMCTKSFLGPIISRSTKWMTGFWLYSSSDTEHQKLMNFHEFNVT